MGIKAQFTAQDIDKFHDDFVQNFYIKLIEALEFTAIEIRDLAKSGKNGIKDYIDRSNNLRSSIGFVLYKDGEQISSNFVKSGAGSEGDGNKGTQVGESVAESIAIEYPKGFVVVMVAGMDYAAYVEAKGYDVITASTLKFEDVLRKNLETITEVTGINFSKVK